MELVRKMKNSVGYLLGYENCPVTGDTFWSAETVEIPYRLFPTLCTVSISEKALEEATPEEIAIKVVERGKSSEYEKAMPSWLVESADSVPVGLKKYIENLSPYSHEEIAVLIRKGYYITDNIISFKGWHNVPDLMNALKEREKDKYEHDLVGQTVELSLRDLAGNRRGGLVNFLGILEKEMKADGNEPSRLAFIKSMYGDNLDEAAIRQINDSLNEKLKEKWSLMVRTLPITPY